MAGFVLGAAGGILGSALGGPIGGAIGQLAGSLLGNLLFPQKIEGPQRTDLKVQHGSYGTPIPFIRGTVRTAGALVYNGDLVPHKEKSGGKGGPEVETTTYTVTYAIKLARAPEGGILGIRRAWANGRLMTSKFPGDLPAVLYTGTRDQDIDPTLEALVGTDNQSAWRGDAYVVFKDHTVTEFGDAIPNWEFEVEASGSPRLERVSYFEPPWSELTEGVHHITGTIDGETVLQFIWDEIEPGFGGSFSYKELRNNLLTGEELESYRAIVWEGDYIDIIAGYNCDVAVFHHWLDADTAIRSWLQGAVVVAEISPVTGKTGLPYSRPLKLGDFLYVACGSGSDAYIAKYGFIDSRPWPTPEVEFFDVSANSAEASVNDDISLSFDDQGYLYAVNRVGVNQAEMFKIDPTDMSLVRYWHITDATLAFNFGRASGYSSTFTVFRDLLVLPDPDQVAVLYRIEDDDSFTELDTEDVDFRSSFPPMLNLEGGYVLTEDGVLKIGTIETLGNIVAAILEDGPKGLDASQFDVSDLTDEVQGYRLASQMTKAAAIQALRPLYSFDAAQVGEQIIFKHRGQDPVASLDSSRLAARVSGSAAPDRIKVEHTPDEELPDFVYINFIDSDADYQAGNELDRRQFGGSGTKVTIEAPVVMTHTRATEIVRQNLWGAWFERDDYVFLGSRRHTPYTALDVVTIDGLDLRIVHVQHQYNGVIEFRAKLSTPNFMDQPATDPALGGGFAQRVGSRAVATTELVLLDIPLLSQNDYVFGFYAAMAPGNSGTWRGANLYKSRDGGSTWTLIASTSSPAVIGDATDDLGTFTGAVDEVDTTNTVTVELHDPDATLESTTADGLAAGDTLCAIKSGGGWELFGYQDATLVDDSTYELANLLRGQKETTDYIVGHAAGDTFVLLSTVINVDAPEEDLDQPFLYKAVTFGSTLGKTPAVSFTNTGEGVDSYSRTETRILQDFVGDEGSPSVPKHGLVPAPQVGDGALEYVLLAAPDPETGRYWGIPSWAGGSGSGATSGGAPLEIKEEGVSVDAAVTSIDVLGASATVASLGAGAVSLSIVQTIHTLDGGVTVDADADSLNANAPISMVDAGGGVTNIVHDNSGVTAATYGTSLKVAQITANVTGHATAISDVDIATLVGDSGSGGTKGLAPAPASGDAVAGKFLSADGTWRNPGSVVGAAGFAVNFGDGSDGDVTFDGASAVTGWTRSGSVYTFNNTTASIKQYNNVAVNSGVTIILSGCPLYVNGTLSGSGTIGGTNLNTRNASGATGGAGSAGVSTGSEYWAGLSAAGANGSIAGATAGNNAATPALGGNGGASGSNTGGAGASGGSAVAPANNQGGIAHAYTLEAIQSGAPRFHGTNGAYNGGAGGAGGRGNGAQSGGGGGGGGAVVPVFARYITFTGFIDAAGGNGAQGGANNCSGGGGGGGGVILLLTTTSSWPFTTSVAGGTKGAANGTGNQGVDGSPGRVVSMVVAA